VTTADWGGQSLPSRNRDGGARGGLRGIYSGDNGTWRTEEGGSERGLWETAGSADQGALHLLWREWGDFLQSRGGAGVLCHRSPTVVVSRGRWRVVGPGDGCKLKHRVHTHVQTGSRCGGTCEFDAAVRSTEAGKSNICRTSLHTVALDSLNPLVEGFPHTVCFVHVFPQSVTHPSSFSCAVGECHMHTTKLQKV
jgi:hypothetical protein